jgi:hypothetical protein
LPTPSAPTVPSTEKLLRHVFFSRKSANATRLKIIELMGPKWKRGPVGTDRISIRMPVFLATH